MFDDEVMRLKERFEREYVPPKVHKNFPTLATFTPEALRRGEDVIVGMDMGRQRMEAMLREIVKFKEVSNEPID